MRIFTKLVERVDHAQEKKSWLHFASGDGSDKAYSLIRTHLLLADNDTVRISMWYGGIMHYNEGNLVCVLS